MNSEISTKEELKEFMRLHAVPRGRYRMVGVADEGRHRDSGEMITDFACETEISHGYKRREVVRRLCDLGLTPGVVFSKLQGHNRGPVLIEIRDTKLALGHGLAKKILVELASDN